VSERRVALVTGGSRGIGRAIALGLAEDGTDVAVSYRREADAAAEVVSGAEALGVRGRAYPATLGTPEAAEGLAAAVLDDLGHVDILVVNAGVASRGLPVTETDHAELERVIGTHALSAHHLCRLLMPQMRERPRGDVVVISSIATRLLSAGGAPYNMAKAALEALAMTLAKEERPHGIRVNVVAPGLVDTEMGRRLVRATDGVEDIHALDARSPFGRVCAPEDVASVVRFLVSDRCAYVTGQRIAVDGGQSWVARSWGAAQ
jgi:NAD(P)-dependent dehydrogenase (short-subunit alcohol dehydrogenase family)